ncbi:hypothetical protein FH608_046845 [Nonomuraea phyllanthi]|uniref:Uncharacterized protein n=1 Tax=Nonomuraea phyllanthi TaxID=2219224 RepID=A0A5C4V455_9ACTN|nr:hypothetical protein [Nonomuraea phyllanthi]KAB8186246.1 hypothetical protein FH608_046845 [Nonomuraea phyllanthi]QFY11574.1 hypothetical protein GBF35_37825 [Nonomuraea phyllanthi]
MLTDELPRSRPHEFHARGARLAPSWSEDQDEAPPQEPARTVHRMRRIRSVRAVTEIDEARHPAP